ncbi:MAG: hypothetical protein JXC32_11585 [Anaerolineae bacterium]|nr:hypothetical protein [Anaerolineae bacterium]
MRILAISDEVNSHLYHANLAEVTGRVDLLLGCGDLPYGYMDFVVTQTGAPHALFVHGNHDRPERLPSGGQIGHPQGWSDADRHVIYLQDLDLLVAGLEGSIRYAPGPPYQYSERQMRWRALSLVPQLLWSRVRHGRYLDILIAHAPAEGIHDSRVGAHRGFRTFLQLMRWFKPRIFLHGHNHRYGPGRWHTHFEGTEVVNVHPFCIIDYDDGSVTYTNLRQQQYD